MHNNKTLSTLICLLLLYVSLPVKAQEVYDVLIRNGRVFDGMGNPWFHADVAINGDRIVAVGDLTGAQGLEEIDAEGLFVAPGFIDTHTHFLMSGVFQMLYYVGPITSYGAKGGTNDPCH